MYKFLLAIVVGLALEGCSVTRDGVRLGVGPSTSDIDNARSQLQRNAESSAAKKVVAGALNSQATAGLILVGAVGPLRKLDEAERNKAYAEYVQIAEKWHPGQPAIVSQKDFVAEVGGWTSIETFSVPGLFNLRAPVVVRNADLDTIGFASTAGSMFLGTTGDLVAAKSNLDGLVLVDRVLCKDSAADYRDCAAQYQRGRFDLSSGAELDRSMKPKEDGVHIDTITFKVLPAKN
ncbi:MAG: hypothetical protein QM625_10300 [Ralstonia sp.]|jgi:hypothetical protein|uniref:Uncharacterized protein n=3 Tax=Bacteria TaxID=2 RepID=A0A2P4REM7_RALPI|nr:MULTISPECIES: hypothetical protein [Ralstonia]MBA4232262.1 hypothetical protein [Ralstonia sp.]MBA4236691.1 hypothetical protein [Ralstonia sp.]MBA4403307.1 hypothetical protein [Ralstonia sp.]MBA9847568.1 hypothetical protein [Ralstonia pickettii]MBA9852967.1 hypothetical protein [Ralstonia pickettii]